MVQVVFLLKSVNSHRIIEWIPSRHVGVTTARGLDISRTTMAGARSRNAMAGQGESQP